jgi:mannose-1-phosphate guanylyltransferase / mannose-6-phosphate isomerase
MTTRPIVPVILCGGAGTRLWPASRKAYPKPFLPLAGPRSSFIETFARVADRAVFAAPVIVASDEHRFLVNEQVREAGISDATVILEPQGRDSAAAIAAAALWIAARDPDAVMLVLAADHNVRDVAGFVATCREALPAAVADRIVTFGVKPDRPSTAYGYIRPGAALGEPGVRAVAEFREKPDVETARRYVAEGMLWNSGNFLMQARRLVDELATHEPDVLHPVKEAVAKAKADLNFQRLDEAAFLKARKISIDYAVMERTTHAAVVVARFDWSDIGSWEALWTLAEKDADGNALMGDVYAHATRGTYVRSEGVTTAVLGLDDAVVVATPDAVLVTTQAQAENVKRLVDNMAKGKHKKIEHHARVHRPWGYYETLDLAERHQVKRIGVLPGGKLSLQMHYHRAEHWVVVRGTARVRVGDVEKILHENESIYIPLGAVHRLENPGKVPLELIEVQSGTYLGEDDIVRLEDLYKREA